MRKRDKDRRFVSSEFEMKRRLMRIQIIDTVSFRRRFSIVRKLGRQSPNCSFSRVQNRCVVTNTARAVYRRFHMGRHAIKKLGCRREIPGLYRKI